MSRVRQTLKPFGLDFLAATRTYAALRDPSWTFSARGQSSRERLRRLHQSQMGEDGFIIGTGPSLRRVDFAKLRGRPSIGLNRLFLGFNDFGFVPDYLVCVNLLMLEQSHRELSSLPCELVAAWAGRRHFAAHEDPIFLRTDGGTGFSFTLLDKVFTGGTVTYVALQLAHWLGWSNVTLIGIDHDYKLDCGEATAGPHGVVERNGPDPNHFDAAYMKTGTSWQVPDLAQSELAYRTARKSFEQTGRHVFDGTVGGKLQVFDPAPMGYGLPSQRDPLPAGE